VKKAQVLVICKASVFFGAQVLRGRETHLNEPGERSSGSYECIAAERTSVFVGTHHPSRGDAGTGGLAVIHLAFARSEVPGASRTRERFRLS